MAVDKHVNMRNGQNRLHMQERMQFNLDNTVVVTASLLNTLITMGIRTAEIDSTAVVCTYSTINCAGVCCFRPVFRSQYLGRGVTTVREEDRTAYGGF